MTVVLDASAILAFVQDERGGDQVEAALSSPALCGSANWSEIAQKIRASGRDWDIVRALLDSYEIEVVPVLRADAEWAAQRWIQGEGLSLADRLCLALAERLNASVHTADKSWGSEGRINQIR